ncbi:TonB-dependent siderophore receptor [Novosphingobium album (ex Hu et al. 2023)]|uniref:TonB-dependent receptor plug domain-containing protein n=1 Tax=Novosphingobium album (ex Hu et al. 2023) TaxID=2930093 RepID=A0ABT0B1W5_9SPHN|nr:TonB-dependent receptor plug domain-containing protein [Novosphingobium album (ex Hu et al. 2023)]MCJ2179015.1 TonB-dependent receptor plug domain-containing protein [Novosphingobium album (ex Hu et al. 2023)]
MTKNKSVDAHMSFAPQQYRLRKPLLAVATSLFCCTALTSPAFADDAAEEPASGEIVVTGSLDALPVSDVGSVFGFEKTITETPRSASTISSEQMERFGITDIYDLVAQSPGAFTNSFFGVGGALDIRGTPGETYFRGMRRLDNPGNYPTPIAASDRIDIVRGPASPIYGPSKTGGYMNFVPKTARVKGGSYLAEPEGQVSFTGGSWEKANLSAEIRGPGKLGSQEFGYSLYAEVEDSGSYYHNMSTKQTVLQAAFDTDLAPDLRLEFGGMYQNYKGQQNGGWNRVTQDLVDNSTYITGAAQPLDTNGDGQISAGEVNSQYGSLSVFGGYGCGAFSPFATAFTDACFTSTYPQLALTNTGTAKLSRKDTLTGKDDRLDNRSTTLYADLIYKGDGPFSIKNQMFYDSYENYNENAYGFSQFHDSWVFEDKIVAQLDIENSAGKFSIQASPSIRYTHFEHGDDYTYEYFNRVDLTVGYNALSDRLLALECPFSDQAGYTASDCGFTNYVKGHYTDLAMAGLVDLDFNFGLDITAGARYDRVKGTSRYLTQYMLDETQPDVPSASGSDGGWSWTASASYKLPFGLIPYVTLARQTTLIAGQGAELYAEDIDSGTFMSASKLKEAGIKGSFLDNRLYAALSVYQQERTDYNRQSITVNQAVKTKGMEAEVRWSVDDHLLLTGAYTRTKVYNLTAITNGTLFSFFGIEDMVNVSDPTLYLGGQPIGLVPIADKNASRRAGIPTNLYSATATYAFDNGIALSGSVVHVPSVYSGQSQAVKLPAYTLVDLGASFETGPWLFRLNVKNATNEKYFRANFTEIFGSTIVLPEKPRSFQATIAYKF